MTSHERQQHNQAAFDAMHHRLAELSSTRTLYCGTPQEYADMKSNFHQLSIQYEEVTCRLANGETAPGFRISTAAFIFLATIPLVDTN